MQLKDYENTPTNNINELFREITKGDLPLDKVVNDLKDEKGTSSILDRYKHKLKQRSRGD